MAKSHVLPSVESHPFNWPISQDLNWHETSNGRLLSKEGRFQVDTYEGMSWLRYHRDNKLPETIWIDREQAACMDAARYFAAHNDAVEKIIRSISPLKIERPTHVPGIKAVAYMGKNMPGLHISSWGVRGPYIGLITERNRRVGSYSTTFTKAIPSYIIGELALCGTSEVHRNLIGRGLGRFMYNFAEEVSGLSLVPHGENLNGGIRTDYSRRFWERRAQHCRVPGFNGEPEVAYRLAQVEDVYHQIEYEKQFYLKGAFAVEVSRVKGWPIETSWSHGDLHASWCLTPDGKAFTSKGYKERGALRNYFSDKEVRIATIDEVISRLPTERTGGGLFLANESARDIISATRLIMNAHRILEPDTDIELYQATRDANCEETSSPGFSA